VDPREGAGVDTTDEVAERMALTLTRYGMQRMAARVLAALLFTEEPTLTSQDLCERLHASAGAVSMAMKTLSSVSLIEQVPVPGSRRAHYRLRDDPWGVVSLMKSDLFEFMREAADDGLTAVDPDGAAARRLVEMRDFYEFLRKEIPALLEHWQAHRHEREAAREAR